MEYLTANWEYFLLGFMILEKIVKITPFKWDDILVDGFKEIIMGIANLKKLKPPQ